MHELGDRERQALLDALDDEYKAWATYDQVITDFGEVRPFINIRESEARHIEALLALARRHGVGVPPNSWIGRAPRFASLQEACAAGVRAEVDNHALYERLLATATSPALREVFQSLQRASQERHLAAFQRCASRGHAGGRGRGRGPGREGQA